jgi:septal ring factor EnvC (AmiA/AmiB activator)
MAGVVAALAILGTALSIGSKFNAVEYQTNEVTKHVDQNTDKLDAVESEVDRHDEQLKAQAETAKEIKAGIDSILIEQRTVSSNVARLQSDTAHISDDIAALKAAIQ